MNTTTDQTAKVWKLAKSIRVAMLTTRHGAGIAARPMYALIPDAEETVWFITERTSGKIAEVAKDTMSLLTFSNGTDGDHVVMAGHAVEVDDRAKLTALWNPGATVFFPKGPTDMQVVLLKFTPDSAEYWTGGSGIVSFALKFAEAKITGNRPVVGEHAKLPM